MTESPALFTSISPWPSKFFPTATAKFFCGGTFIIQNRVKILCNSFHHLHIMMKNKCMSVTLLKGLPSFFWRNRATCCFATSWEAPQIMPEHIDVVQTDPGPAPIPGSRFSDYCNGDHVLERWEQSRSNSKGGRIQLHIPRGRASPCVDGSTIGS